MNELKKLILIIFKNGGSRKVAIIKLRVLLKDFSK